MDAFSLVHSKLSLAKLSLLIFGATFAELHSFLSAYVAALFVTSVCRWLTVRG